MHNGYNKILSIHNKIMIQYLTIEYSRPIYMKKSRYDNKLFTSAGKNFVKAKYLIRKNYKISKLG